MISFDEALRTTLDAVPLTKESSLPAERALGLALTRPVRARFKMPRYDQSAMDGIAVRVEDVRRASSDRPVTLAMAGEMPAGTHERLRLAAGTAIQVFTGSPLPRGTEAVVMVEDCEFVDQRVHVHREAAAGQHIRRAGEEVERGDEILCAGVRVTPPVVGLLAMFGIESVRVRPWPRVGVITMGDELAGKGQPLGATRIYDSNGPALIAALRGMGVSDVRSWRVDDRPRNLERALGKALDSRDVVITVGGASVGAHDHVASVRAKLGVETLFDRVAIKPGKPNVFGLGKRRRPVFSLPGNPVSALVSFHQLVRPALRHMVGLPPDDACPSRAILARPVRKKQGRVEWLRGTVAWDGDRWHAFPVLAQGSHMLSGLAGAQVLIEIPEASGGVDQGEEVAVQPLHWFD